MARTYITNKTAVRGALLNTHNNLLSNKYKHQLAFLAPILMMAITALNGAVMTSGTVSADAIDRVLIHVPVICTMSGAGMSSHNANIQNGTYDSAIGETTVKAYCNDSAGFAIYGIGYTDDEDGKNVLANATLGNTYDITTGTATS